MVERSVVSKRIVAIFRERFGIQVGMRMECIDGIATVESHHHGVFHLSYTVDRSTSINQPITAVSFNYRLSAWEFL